MNKQAFAGANKGALGLAALLAALGGGSYYYGKKALKDYDMRSPFQKPWEVKSFSNTRLKEIAKDPKTYLTLLALTMGGWGAYKWGKNRAQRDILPDPQFTKFVTAMRR